MSNASLYHQTPLRVPNVEETYSWHEQFYYFALFRTLNGPEATPGKDCDAPINDDTRYTQACLCGWIREQNAARKAFLDGRASALTADQIRVLDGVSFPWVRDSSERWDGHYRELLAFREAHGHTDVPRSAGALGVWVKNQRAAYLRLREVAEGRGGDSRDVKKTTAVITPDQVRLLEEVGFRWKIRIEHAVAWNAHYEKLRAFKEARGHCRVSAKDDVGLSRWIFEMRSRRKKQAAGERPRIRIKEEQIARLDDLGFEWKGWGGDPEEKRRKADESKARRNEARKRKRAEVRLRKEKEAEERRKEEEEAAAAAAREKEGGGAEDQVIEADTEKRRKAEEAKRRRNERRRRKRAEVRLQKQKEAGEEQKEEESADDVREEEGGGAEEQTMVEDADLDEKSPLKKRQKTGGDKPKSAGQTTDDIEKLEAKMRKTKPGTDRVNVSVDRVKNDNEERLAENILVESGVAELEEDEGVVHC